jgi:hypothetical protein
MVQTNPESHDIAQWRHQKQEQCKQELHFELDLRNGKPVKQLWWHNGVISPERVLQQSRSRRVAAHPR